MNEGIELKKIVVMGRGGTGKTSFVTLMSRYFIEIHETPLLLVDADPDQSLSDMIGVDMLKEGKRSISDLLITTFIEGGVRPLVFHHQSV